ncbi:MAG: sugar transferase [Deltaproteobacteria bacterium]|nr:sugar transferase [Deltaproteobacteria bacterium]
MQLSSRPSLRSLVLLLDGLGLAGSLVLAWALHHGLRNHITLMKDAPDPAEYLKVVILVVPIWLVAIPFFGLDRVFDERWSRRWLLGRLLRLQGTGLLALAGVLFLTQLVVNRSIIGLFTGCSFLTLYLLRAGIQLRLAAAGLREERRPRLVLVGAEGPGMEAFLRRAAGTPRPPRILGRLGEPEQEGGLPHLGPLERLGDLLQGEAVDGVFFFRPFRGPADAAEAVARCETVGVPAAFLLDPEERPRSTPRLEERFGTPFIVYDVSPKAPAALAVKHLLDLVCAGLLVFLISPLLLTIALLIRLRMGRPVFFSQERAGLNGRSFRMIKFRTMVRDAEARKAALEDRNEMSGPVFKVTDDDRITPLGRWLRAWSLDELPQLFNVLRGHMSLVGPRPLPVYEQERIRGWHRRRLSMRPGITGLWQVSGRNEVDFGEWMRLDLAYIDTWSLGKDLGILLRTVGAVLGRRGAR